MSLSWCGIEAWVAQSTHVELSKQFTLVLIVGGRVEIISTGEMFLTKIWSSFLLGVEWLKWVYKLAGYLWRHSMPELRCVTNKTICHALLSSFYVCEYFSHYLLERSQFFPDSVHRVPEYFASSMSLQIRTKAYLIWWGLPGTGKDATLFHFHRIVRMIIFIACLSPYSLCPFWKILTLQWKSQGTIF